MKFLAFPPPLPPGLSTQEILEHLRPTGWLLVGGWVIAPIIQFVERFFWSDWEFAAMLGIMVFLDTLTGVLCAWLARSISSRRFYRTFLKITAYGVTLTVVHTLSHHTVHGQPNTVFGAIVPFFDSVVYAAILFREALSIHENLTQLGYPLLPPFITRRLQRFQQEGWKAVKPAPEAQETPPGAGPPPQEPTDAP